MGITKTRARQAIDKAARDVDEQAALHFFVDHLPDDETSALAGDSLADSRPDELIVAYLRTALQKSKETADVDQVISKAVSQALEAYDAKCNPRSVAFSKVGESVAYQVYTANHVTIIDGNVFAPLPSNTLPPCGVFDMASYADEARALPTLQQHIQHGLEMNGVSFQRGGFTLADVHESTNLILPHNKNTYKGGVDMAIVPYGVHSSSLGQWRAAVDVKHSAKHKALYREKHGGPPAVGNESDVQLTGAAMGQSLMEVLSAFVYSEWPQFALLWTSVDTNAVMVLSAGQLYLWKELSFDAAMWKLAEYLKNCDSIDRKYSLEAHRNVVPEEEFNEAERLRKRLKVQSMVAEQLASLDPFVTDPYERFCLARQLIHEAAPTSMYI